MVIFGLVSKVSVGEYTNIRMIRVLSTVTLRLESRTELYTSYVAQPAYAARSIQFRR